MQGQATAANRLQHLFAGRRRQDEIRVRRDFFKSLEECVRGGIVHAVGLGDNDHTDAVALEGEGRCHGTDKPNGDFCSGIKDIDAVRVHENFFYVGLLKILDRLGGAPRRNIVGAFRMRFLAFHGHNPIVRDAGIGSHLATETMPTGTHVRVAALERLRDFDGQGLLADAHGTVYKNRLRETVFTQRSHQPDALTFLGYGSF